jgi:cyclohexanone monooxygenase
VPHADHDLSRSGEDRAATQLDVLVVGAGFAGLAMLHRLRGQGFSVRAVEAGSGIGGTWFWNRYPGARCDVDSTDYSFSFPEVQSEWQWSERYATQPEILRYIDFVVERLELRSAIDLGARVVQADWQEAGRHWTVLTADGREYVATYLVMATGCLSAVKRPDIEGVDDFTGAVLHTADWPADGADLDGKRVGVIGTGSSGIQLIPTIAAACERLTVFQRTAAFSVPAHHHVLTDDERAAIIAEYPDRRERARNSPTGLAGVPANRQSALEVTAEERRRHYEDWWDWAGFGFLLSYSDLLTSRPANDTAAEFIRGQIAERVTDPAVAEKLMPRTYPYGAKRPCVDTGYYETFNRPNVELVDIAAQPIVKLTPASLHTTAAEYELDVLVMATGFDAMTGALLRPLIRGRDGVTLAERWSSGPQTYLGLGVSGFPNLFIVAGPGSPSLLGNVIVSIEHHAGYIAAMLAAARDEGVTWIEPEATAEQWWVQHVNEAAAATLYTAADSYYLGAEVPGKPRVFMPYAGGLRRYRRECDEVRDQGYRGFIRR